MPHCCNFLLVLNVEINVANFPYFHLGSTYFFRGKEYWKVLDNKMEAEQDYPQITARDWLVCSDMQSDGPSAESSRTGAHSRQGQRDESRSSNAFEVCSCTSSAEYFSISLSINISLILVHLFTVALVSFLWCAYLMNLIISQRTEGSDLWS